MSFVYRTLMDEIDVCVKLMCLFRENMKKIFKWFWHHSDIGKLAFFYVHRIFEKIVAGESQ